ncbi:MAG: HD domain-containing protein [Flavobacteriales bacterium]|nr:HD domain-containing protein [Flavobacteriales bacterium]
MLTNNKDRNKLKIINDPVYGFIAISDELIFDLIEHRYFQRLRRISQTALTSNVYPGAHHTRFHHAIGAMHLTKNAIEVLKFKGHDITDDEELGALIAILLHDMGHGPYSHALEHSIIPSVSHEEISVKFMEKLNIEFDGRLSLAIEIFRNSYKKKFLHQLISSQLDMDRLDYLNRDSFYSGVVEGAINSKRLITMLNVANDNLAIEDKGIYSVEKFLVARRLMYWQVYLHKTVIVSEALLTRSVLRAKKLRNQRFDLFASSALKYFLERDWSLEGFNDKDLEMFSKLDDYDVFGAIKEWTNHEDKILSDLSTRLVDRKLFKIQLGDKIIDSKIVDDLKNKVAMLFNISYEEAENYVIQGKVQNNAYRKDHDSIFLLKKNGDVQDIAFSPDQQSVSAISEAMKKYYLIYPRELE